MPVFWLPVVLFRKAAAAEIKNLLIENYKLAEGIENSTVAMLDFAIKTQEAKTAANDLANEASILFGPNGIFEKGGGFTVLGFEIVKTDEEKLRVLQDQRNTVIELAEQEERQKNNKQILLELSKAILEVKEHEKKVEEATAAVTLDTLTALRRRNQLAQAYLDGGEAAVEAEKKYHDILALTKELQSDKYDLSETELAVIIKQLQATQELESKVAATKEELKEATKQAELLASALASAATFSGNLDKSVEGLKARLAEARGEQGAVLANTVKQMEAEARLSRAKSIAAGEDALVADARLAIDLKQIETYKELTTAIKVETEATKKSGKVTKKVLSDAEKAALEYAKSLDNEVIGAIGGVADAWGDFVVRGFNDFSSFRDAVLGSFKSMISNMIAMAAKNRIMLSLGIGGVGAGGAVQAAGSIGGTAGSSILTGGGMLSGTAVGGALGAATTGLGTGFMSSVYGGLGGMTGAISGGLSVGGIGGIATAIGAVAAPLLAVAAVFSFFKKKTKELDSGLRITVSSMDAVVKSFSTIKTKRFWGLSKKVSTSESEVASDISDPIVEGVVAIQKSIVDAAGSFGIASDVFDKFIYDMEISLKGLTEEERIAKINEELTKMGDEFASLTGHFETMNELLAAANQRMELQNRLDQLLGNNQAILTRQREAELSAMHELNRPLAQAIYDLEDANAAVANSFAALRASIDAEKARVQDSFATVLDGLKERLDVVNEALSQSRNVYEMLSNALSSRGMQTDAAFSGRRSSALAFLRGGDFTDEQRLDDALSVVAEPSEQLFGSFTDYQRDFYTTSRVIAEAAETAKVQLTADEQQVVLLEQQIAEAEANKDEQLAALEQQYQMMVNQYNALMGIDTSVKGVSEAIGTLRGAIEALAAAQAAAKAAAAAQVGATGGGGSFADTFGTGTKYDGYDLAALSGANDLLKAAGLAGVDTSGKTGAQIQQDISNATQMAVQLDSSTRARQFAMGGYHTGGLRMVGERGPELEATGPSRIFSHNQTAGMFKDPDLKEAVNDLRREVSGLRSEQRQMQATNAKYVKRNYDINRKWDVDGLPATRT